MLLSGDLGFSSTFLLFWALASVFFAAIGLVARRKWRLALAREEEVKRLMILASEESARAELEALSMYSTAPRPPSPSYPLSLCAVCFSPTNTRCARCKAVRYCSGKCQIIHWRQGHKEDCCPPKTDCQNNDKGSNFCHNAAKQGENDNCELDREKVAKPFEEPALSNSTPSFKPPCGGDGDSKAKHLSDGSETNLIMKSAHASISNSATLSSESFYDASDGDGEFSSTTHPKSSEETKCAGVLSDIRETPTSTSSRNHQTEPKFPVTQIVSDTSLDSCTFTDSSVGETHIESETSLDANSDGSDGGSCANPSKSSPSFLKETLELTKRPNSDNEKINLGIAGDGNSYEAGAFKEFSFNLSGYAVPLLSLDSEVKPVAVLAANNPIDGVALSNHNSKGISEDNNFPSVTSESCSQIGCDPVCDLDISKPKVVTSLPSEYHTLSRTRGNANTSGSLGASGSSKLIFERPKFLDGSLRSTSHLVTSERAGSYSNDVVDDRPSSKDLNDKLGKFDVNHGGAPNLRYPPNVSNGLKTSVLKVVDHIRPSKSSKQYSEGGICEVSKRYGEKGLFSYEMFVKLYHWKKVELQPCGLTNCGNSCYANVVLQCLAFTPPLTAFHLQGFHSKACEKKEWCFTCEFERLIQKAKEGRSPLSPIGILSQVGKISSQLISGKEEDAHEFLRYVIDTMQSIYLKEAGTNRLKVFGEETTLIGLTFGGYLRSKIKCMKCRGKSEQHERMMDLTVEIEGDIGSLEEALRKFTSTEILDGKNKYSCSRCKSYERAKKKFTVLEAPNVLTIALKRFQSGKFGKLNKSIRFPEILDLAPYMSGTGDKSPVYSLYGVVVHLDIMNAAFSGHYVCYVKNIQNKWFKIDDSTVKAVDRETVLSKGAYMLLYARCSPRAPRSIRNALTSHEVKNPLPKFPTPYPSWILSDLHMGRTKIADADSSSDNSSLISGSDEGSCSTESSRDSSSTSDFSDYIFGDLGGGWNSPFRGASSDSDTSSLYSRPLWHTDLDRYSSSPKSRPQNVEGGGVLGRRVPDSISRPEDSRKR